MGRFRCSGSLITAAMLSTAIVLQPTSVRALCEYFDFRLDSDQVVPFANSQGSGWSELQLCDDDSIHGYIVINVEQAVTAVHIHGPAEPGQNGALLYELPLPTQQGLAVRLGPVTEEQRAWFVGYRTYVDVHTVTHPDGAIRGQILDQGTGVVRTPWHAVKRLFR